MDKGTQLQREFPDFTTEEKQFERVTRLLVTDAIKISPELFLKQSLSFHTKLYKQPTRKVEPRPSNNSKLNWATIDNHHELCQEIHNPP